MAFAWFLSPYVRQDVQGKPGRIPQIYKDFSTAINADGGKAAGTEVLGDQYLVAVRASVTTIANMDATVGFTRFPRHWDLSDSLSDFTAQEKLAIRNKLLNMGYSQQEITDAVGDDLGTKTLRDLLRFVASRCKYTEYDSSKDAIVFTKDEYQPIKPEPLASAVV